jgi:hypothetical protein
MYCTKNKYTEWKYPLVKKGIIGLFAERELAAGYTVTSETFYRIQSNRS